MVNKYQSKLLSLFIILITFLAYSCAPKYKYVDIDSLNIIKMQIKPGDNVKITTMDSNEHEFEVVDITNDAIVGENEKVFFTDIHKFQKMVETSGKRTGKVIAGTVFIIILGAAYVAAGVAGAAAGVHP